MQSRNREVERMGKKLKEKKETLVTDKQTKTRIDSESVSQRKTGSDERLGVREG